jgi:hypothetical protein
MRSLGDCHEKFKEEADKAEISIQNALKECRNLKECKGDFGTVLLECDTLTALLKQELDQVSEPCKLLKSHLISSKTNDRVSGHHNGI